MRAEVRLPLRRFIHFERVVNSSANPNVVTSNAPAGASQLRRKSGGEDESGATAVVSIQAKIESGRTVSAGDSPAN